MRDERERNGAANQLNTCNILYALILRKFQFPSPHRTWKMNGQQLHHKYRPYYRWTHHHCPKKTIRCHSMLHLISHWMIKSNFSLLSYFIIIIMVFVWLVFCFSVGLVQFSISAYFFLFAIVDIAYLNQIKKDNRKKKIVHIRERNIIIMFHIFNFVIVLFATTTTTTKIIIIINNNTYFRDDCMIRIHDFLRGGEFEHAVIMLRSAR